MNGQPTADSGMLDFLEQLYRYDHWSNERILAMLRGLPTPPQEAMNRFAHLFAVGKLWEARIAGLPDSDIDLWPAVTIADLDDLIEHHRADFINLIRTKTVEQMSERIHYKTSRGIPYKSTLNEILHHIVMHGTYHRAQVITMLKEAGSEIINIDFIGFARVH